MIVRPAQAPVFMAGLLLVGLSALCSNCSQRKPVLVFHAASLSRVLSDAKEQFEKSNPDLEVRLEPSGSQVAARKVAELNLRADLVVSADAQVIDDILVPQHAGFSIAFASNEVVLAHGQHSRFTEEITSENWPGILLRPGVKLGRGNENLAPIGFHTLLVWKLAEGFYGEQAKGLEVKLLQAVPAERVMPDIAELVSLLEARAIDYAFVYRNVAEEHNLKVIRLPPEINLGSLDRAAAYARAEVQVKMKSAGIVHLRGSPILLGLTIPRNAPNPAAAEKFAAFLLGEGGRRILRQSGIEPLPKPRCKIPEALPESLKPLVAAKVDVP